MKMLQVDGVKMRVVDLSLIKFLDLLSGPKMILLLTCVLLLMDEGPRAAFIHMGQWVIVL